MAALTRPSVYLSPSWDLRSDDIDSRVLTRIALHCICIHGRARRPRLHLYMMMTVCLAPASAIQNFHDPSIHDPSIHGGLTVLVARTPAAMRQLSLLIPIRARPTPTVFAAVAFPPGSKRVEDAAVVQVSVQNGDGMELKKAASIRSPTPSKLPLPCLLGPRLQRRSITLNP